MRPITVSIPATSAAATASEWVYFDQWSPGPAGVQVNVAGTVNYTVQVTFDDPNSPTNPVVPASVAWLPCADTDLVGANADKIGSLTPVPVFARVLLNSGNGSLSATFTQLGNVTY
jgi:hypothetical protein